jgi:transposase-like protein
MTKTQYQRYSPELKRHALKRASEDGVMDKDICAELGMSRRQLRRRRDQYCSGQQIPDTLLRRFS